MPFTSEIADDADDLCGFSAQTRLVRDSQIHLGESGIQLVQLDSASVRSQENALLGLLGIIMINTDILMLSFLKSESEVGLYAAANRPVQIFYVIPEILAAALFPITSRLANKDNNKLRAILE